MRCFELHKESRGCEQEISESDNWKFCPHCGRSLGVFFAESTTFTTDIGVATKGLLFLQNRGFAALNVDISLTSHHEQLTFLSNQSSRVAVPPKQQVPIQLSVAARNQSSQDQTVGRVLVTVEDDIDRGFLRNEQGVEVRRADFDPWEARRKRTVPIDVKVTTIKPAHVVLQQEAFIFHRRQLKRIAFLVNEGEKPDPVTDISVPQGYSVEPLTGLPSDPLGKRIDYQITCVPGKSPVATGEITFHLQSGQQQTARVFYQNRRPASILPSAIIGVDFGTAFTTVVLREYAKAGIGGDDPVVFIGYPGEDGQFARRFPTRIWVGKDGDMAFGWQATERFNGDIRAGYLIREIKTLLRDPANPKIELDPADTLENAVDFLEQRFGPEWPQELVAQYLTWLKHDLIDPAVRARLGPQNQRIRYVFSLPVLDFASGHVHQHGGGEAPVGSYERQKSEMIECLQRAGFARDSFDFQFEPVCAALGLLRPPREFYAGDEAKLNEWPQFGQSKYPLETGNTIAIFDSGGGTTDVVLMEAEVEDNRIQLQLLRCLGVDSKLQTFGGEFVTDQLIQTLLDPTPMDAKLGKPFYQGTFSRPRIFGGNVDASSKYINPLAARDIIEDLKIALAKNTAAKVPDWDEPEGNRTVKRTLSIEPIVLPALIEGHCLTLQEELTKRVYDVSRPQDVTYYLNVGGNTAILWLQNFISRSMGESGVRSARRLLRLPEEFRQLVVAYGTVFVPDARIQNAVPYALSIRFLQWTNGGISSERELISEDSIVEVAANSSAEIEAYEERFVLDSGSLFQIQIRAELANRERPIVMSSDCFPSPDEIDPIVRVLVSFTRNALKVDYSFESGDGNYRPMLIKEYEL